jgi:hypothetical protein
MGVGDAVGVCEGSGVSVSVGDGVGSISVKTPDKIMVLPSLLSLIVMGVPSSTTGTVSPCRVSKCRAP